MPGGDRERAVQDGAEPEVLIALNPCNAKRQAGEEGNIQGQDHSQHTTGWTSLTPRTLRESVLLSMGLPTVYYRTVYIVTL